MMYPLNNKDFFPDKFSEQNKPDVSLGFIFLSRFKKIDKIDRIKVGRLNFVKIFTVNRIKSKIQNIKENASDISLLWSKSWNKTYL